MFLSQINCHKFNFTHDELFVGYKGEVMKFSTLGRIGVGGESLEEGAGSPFDQPFRIFL